MGVSASDPVPRRRGAAPRAALFVAAGAAVALSPAARTCTDAPLLFLVAGDDTGQRTGQSLAGIGDVNHDGVPDLAVGVPGDSSIWPVQGHGSVRVVSGATGGTLLILIAPTPSLGFGETVAAAGDLDGDGVCDVLVGAPEDTVGPYKNGSAYAFSGATGALLLARHGDAAYDRFGRAVAGVGDLDLDGTGDIAVTAPGSDVAQLDNGAVFLIGGGGQAIATVAGHYGNVEFGANVRGIDDVDGDGRPDLLVAAPRDDQLAADAGSVRLFASGSWTMLRSWHGTQAGEALGVSLDAIADLDHDGRMDVLMGSYGGASLQGRVLACSSATSAPLVAHEGGAPGALLGLAVAAFGDQDGDGRPEILAGAPFADGGGVKSGAAAVVSTQGGASIAEVTDVAPAKLFGYAVASLGDIDQDGRFDFAVGQPGFDTAVGEGVGRVLVFAGTPVLVQSVGEGCPGSGGFVPTLSTDSCPAPGGPLSIHIAKAIGKGVAWLGASSAAGEALQPNGCVVRLGPAPILVPVPLGGNGPGGGSATVYGHLPVGGPSGLALRVQAFVPDPGAPGGFCASAALAVHLP